MVNHFKPIEGLLKIVDVPNYILSQTGVRRHVWCIYHWIKVGRRSYSNHLIKLKTDKICGQIFTRQAWVMDFLRKLEG